MNCNTVLGEPTTILLALLLILPSAHAQFDPLNLNSSGISFLAAYPENIAYYHPALASNKIELTSMEKNAVVTITSHDGVQVERNVPKSETITYPVGQKFELRRHSISTSTLRITSDSPIIVRAINNKDQSIQTSLLTASDKLGNVYKIPPMSHQQSMNPSDVPEEAPFTVIVMNTHAPNTVQWKGPGAQDYSLAPFELAQFWMSQTDAVYEVEALSPVSVLFGHPCAIIFNCTCGMLVTPLDPVSDTERNFFIPSDFTTDAEDQGALLIAGKASARPYDPDRPTVKSVGSVVFHRPGLLLSIIPQEDFSACFYIYIDGGHLLTESYAVVIVHKDHRDQVYHGSELLSDPNWSNIKTTDYVSTSVQLLTGKNVFWHPKAMMAVYYMASKENLWFGNPAAVISKHTNLKGCVITPEMIHIGYTTMGWVESLRYCQDQGLGLASIDGTDMRLLAPKLHAKNAALTEVWIGFRRSSLTGDWYRLSREEVVDTHWGEGEPGGPEEGQCAMMSLDPKEDFGWRDESCCTAAVPLCYKPPMLFTG